MCKIADLATLLEDHIIAQYGVPAGIVTDRGSVFTSAFWSDLCFVAKIKRRLSTAFHPQTDGQTERQNQTMEQYLRCCVADEQDAWASWVPLAEFASNKPSTHVFYSLEYTIAPSRSVLTCELPPHASTVDKDDQE